RYTLIAYAISAFMTALGGSYYAQFVRFINPERIFGIELSIDMALMSIIGGQGTVLRPLLGALFLTPIAELTRTYLGGQFIGLHRAINGLVLILAVLYLPKGILHPLQQLGARLAGRNPTESRQRNHKDSSLAAASSGDRDE